MIQYSVMAQFLQRLIGQSKAAWSYDGSQELSAVLLLAHCCCYYAGRPQSSLYGVHGLTVER